MPGVAPHPGAVVALDGVVQDAAAKRGLRASGVVLDGARQQLVEAVEARRSVDEIGDARRLAGVDPGRDVDEDESTHQPGRGGRQGDGGQAPQRHAHHATGGGRQLGHDGGEVGAVGGRGRDPVRPAVGVAVAGQVDRQERPSQCQSHGVPGVGVLRSAVDHDELGRAGLGAPQETRDQATVADFHLHPSHVGGTVVGQSVLGGVLVEQAELVVGDHLGHRYECPIPVTRPGGGGPGARHGARHGARPGG